MNEKTDRGDLEKNIARLEDECTRLKWENRSLSRRYEVAQASIIRSKSYNASKEKLLTLVTDEKLKQEKYFNLLLKNTQRILILLDENKRFVYCSDELLHQTGIPDSAYIAGVELHRVFMTCVDHASVEYIQKALNQVIAERRPLTIERAMDIGFHGATRHYAITINPMLGEQDSASGLLLMFTDETEILLSREEAEKAREQAETANKAKSSFLARMSHEIRTPMNAIIGMSELALRDTDSPGMVEYLTHIRQAGSNLLSIINDILDLSKIESGSFHLASAPYSFSAMISSVINVIRVRFTEKDILVLANIDANIPNNLVGDEMRIRQILLNLLSNAIKYTNEGFVRFSATGRIINKERIELKFEVADSGIGIKKEDLGSLFGDFVRLDQEHNKGVEGTGLGLAITRKLCQQMGGDIAVDSVYGEGSVFTVNLPQIYMNIDKMAWVENAAEKSVLVYDDRSLYAESISASLENLGVTVSVAASEDDFFSQLETGRFSFAFVSTVLVAHASGTVQRLNSATTLVLLAELGDTTSFQNIPVILMPAYSCTIAKVLNGVSLKPQIRKPTVRFTAPAARVLVVDDIVINLKVVQGLLMPYRMKVDVCENGKRAIALVKTNHYDMVFMDHLMPGMDGMVTAANIRALEGEYFKKLPIIALTANALTGMQEVFLAKGFNGYLAKPIDLPSLNELMEKWIPREKRRKPESLTGSPAKRDGADAGQRADAAQVSEKRKWPAGRPAGSDRIALLRLKKALEAKDTIAIDLALDELLPMTLGNAQKKMLSEIWDYVIAADFKNAAVLVDKQLSASSEKRRKTAVAG